MELMLDCWTVVSRISVKVETAAYGLPQWERWTPSFGQPASGVKVDSMGLVRLLTVSFLLLYPEFSSRHPQGTGFSCG